MFNELPWLVFGGGGHEREYCLNFQQYDHDHFIPMSISRSLQERLPGWDVCNRGTRIEIVCKAPYGVRNDAVVYPAVFEVAGAFNFDTNVLLVADEQNDCELVRCAILAESDDCWTVKPLCEREFDEREWPPENRAFHMALWRVAKTDLSAQLDTRDRFSTGRLHRLVVERALAYVITRSSKENALLHIPVTKPPLGTRRPLPAASASSR